MRNPVSMLPLVPRNSDELEYQLRYPALTRVLLFQVLKPLILSCSEVGTKSTLDKGYPSQDRLDLMGLLEGGEGRDIRRKRRGLEICAFLPAH